MTKEDEGLRWFAAEQIRMWLWAVEDRGQRFMAAAAAPSTNEAPAKWARPVLQDEFISDLGKLIRVLNEVRDLVPEANAILSQCALLSEKTRRFRGLVEHAEEYHFGEGKFPDEWLFVSEDRIFSADASSLLVTDQGHLIGGRICVEEVLKDIVAAKAIIA